MANITVKTEIDMQRINSKFENAKKAVKIAVTESVVQFGNMYVRVDQGTLRDSSLIASQPTQGLAIWDTPYAKKVYYTGTPSKDVNPQASLMWVDKAIKKHKRELQEIAQNAFTKGFKT